MTWLRKWRILVTDNKDNMALDISELRITFEVRYARETNNFATVNIYNLNNQTEQKIIKEGDRVIIEAGYEQQAESGTAQYGKLFDGKVVYPSRRKDNNTDYVLTLLCVDGNNPLGQVFVAKTLNRGLNQRQILNAACANAETPVPIGTITDGISSAALPRGKVLFGTVKGVLDDVARGNGATYYSVGGVVSVVKDSDTPPAEAIVVTPTTGLVGMPNQTQYGASFQLLLNPAVTLGTMIQLKNSEINEVQAKPGEQVTPLDDEWIYQVIEVVHTGDTRGNNWYTNVTGVSRYGRGALPALLANARQNPQGV